MGFLNFLGFARNQVNNGANSEQRSEQRSEQQLPHCAASVMLLEEKMSKKVRKWRMLAIILFLAIVVKLLTNTRSHKNNAESQCTSMCILRINIQDFIAYENSFIEQLNALKKDSKVRGVILSINSGGGEGVGGESLFVALNELSKYKPVVSSIGSVCASAAYLTAAASDKIYAYSMSMVGSVGVFIQGYEATELAKKAGVNFLMYKSSPLKALMNPYEKMSSVGEKEIKKKIEGLYNIFSEEILKSRKLAFLRHKLNDTKYLKANVLNAQIFSGKDALHLGLIDEIGSEEDAKEWLVKTYDLSPNLKIQDLIVEEKEKGFWKKFFLSLNQEILNFFSRTSVLMS